MVLDDVVADRQTEPGAFSRRLGGKERFENLALNLLRDARSVVRHTDADEGALFCSGHG